MQAATIIAKFNIPPDLVVNGDQTTLPIFTSAQKTKVLKGTKK